MLEVSLQNQIRNQEIGRRIKVTNIGRKELPNISGSGQGTLVAKQMADS